MTKRVAFLLALGSALLGAGVVLLILQPWAHRASAYGGEAIAAVHGGCAAPAPGTYDPDDPSTIKPSENPEICMVCALPVLMDEIPEDEFLTAMEPPAPKSPTLDRALEIIIGCHI